MPLFFGAALPAAAEAGFPFASLLDSSVFPQDLGGFPDGQRLDRVSPSGHGRCSKHRVVDRLLGGFYHGQKQRRHGVIRQHLGVPVSYTHLLARETEAGSAETQPGKE